MTYSDESDIESPSNKIQYITQVTFNICGHKRVIHFDPSVSELYAVESVRSQILTPDYLYKIMNKRDVDKYVGKKRQELVVFAKIKVKCGRMRLHK